MCDQDRYEQAEQAAREDAGIEPEAGYVEFTDGQLSEALARREDAEPR